MASEVISIESWKQQHPDRMGRIREARPEAYRIQPTGDEETDRRRQAVMDDLWTWPEKIRERIVNHVSIELHPLDDEQTREMRMEGLGLDTFERARARTGEFSDARFWQVVKSHLDEIRDVAANLRTEIRLGGWAQIIAHRRERLSSLKFSLRLWMFRHGVRRLDPVELGRVEIDELRERLATVEKLIRSNVRTAESAAASLETGTFRSGRNKGKPLTEVRRYSIDQERKRDLELVARFRSERIDLLRRLAQLESRGARARLA